MTDDVAPDLAETDAEALEDAEPTGLAVEEARSPKNDPVEEGD